MPSLIASVSDGAVSPTFKALAYFHTWRSTFASETVKCVVPLVSKANDGTSDETGHPEYVGIDSIDQVAAAVRRAMM